MKTLNERILDRLQRVINKILFLKKKSIFEFRGVEFFPSEVHLMLVIKDKSATNATRIADRLGVTKGAVSQTLSRLEKKGVLRKTKDPFNRNELTLDFTSFGAAAFENYSIHAAGMLKKHDRYLEGFTDNEKGTVLRFLMEVEKVFDEVE